MQGTDEAEHATGIGALIAILSACNFIIGMGAFVIVGLVDPIATDLTISVTSAGGLLTVYALGYAVLSPLLVAATGRIGRRRVLFFGLAIFAAANALLAVLPGIATLYAARLLAAAGAGMVTPVTAAVAAGLSTPENRGRALAAVFFGLTLAQVVGVPVGSWIAYTFGWRVAFAIVALAALPCLWLVWTRVPAGLSFAPVALRDLGRVLGNLTQMTAVLFTASFLAGIYVVFTFLAPLLSQTMGYGRDGITLVLVVFGVGAVIGNLAGGWLTDRIGPMKTLTLLCLAQIVLMALFSSLPVPGVALLALVFTWSVFGWSFVAPQQLRLITLAPEEASVLLALNAAAIYVGAALGSALGGAVLEGFGLNALGIAGAFVGLGALAHLMWSHRRANLERR